MTYRYIYKITCTAGSFKGKFYFGRHITENLDDGYKGSGRKLQYYYKKYPKDYIKEIIAFYKSDEELNQAEYDIIKPWLNTEICLNLKEGGGNNKLSEETKKKISIKAKNRKLSEETKKKIGLKASQHKHSEETKKKISESAKGKHSMKHSEEHRKKTSISLNKYYETHEGINKGRRFSEETKKKMSESQKKRNKQPMTGKHLSEETKKKISKALKGKKYNKNIKERKL